MYIPIRTYDSSRYLEFASKRPPRFVKKFQLFSRGNPCSIFTNSFIFRPKRIAITVGPVGLKQPTVMIKFPCLAPNHSRLS
ncbi:hypothetical protein HanPSC8_Chr06g0241401 [Helianthus annuus]|nr:hypothetical protein HanPSC8_Chr06g0241401 [Helianthus annuus]